MTNSCEPWSIVLVPRPLTPFAAFAWYVMSELLPLGGPVCRKRFFRWIERTHPRGEVYSPHGVVLNLNAERGLLERELLKWLLCKLTLVDVPYDSNSKSIPVREFVFQGGRWQGKLHKEWTTWEAWFQELSLISNPLVALNLSNAFFGNLIEAKVDPRRTKVDFPLLSAIPVQIALPDIPGLQFVTVPFVKKRGMFDSITEHREVTDFSIKLLVKKNIFRLLSEHTLLAIGGPSSSGKSTLVSSLFVEVTNIISSLVSEEGLWKALKLVVDVADDAATPVAGSILSRTGQDRELVGALKREWTMKLAAESVADDARKLESANLVIAGLPGKITEITEFLSARISFGGIVTNDWGRVREWRDYFESVGVPILFELKSSDAPSLVTTYLPGKKVMGRVHKLDRVAKGWDHSIRMLSELLLFDILPKMLEKSAKHQPTFDTAEVDRQITL